MARAIHSGEKLHYLFYSPVWDGLDAPFGFHALPASHAVAVTESRFLLSIDHHVASQRPSLREVPFTSVLSVDIGGALLLGWLSFRFVEKGSLSTKALFFRATGSRHFEAALRVHRSLTAGRGRSSGASAAGAWAVVRAEAPPSFSQVEPLLLDDEQPRSFAYSPLVWNKRRGRRAPFLCAARASFFLLTSHGLLVTLEEPGPRPEVRSYGVNVSLFRDEVVRFATLDDGTSGDHALLHLTVGIGASSTRLDFPVDRGRIDDLRGLASSITETCSPECAR